MPETKLYHYIEILDIKKIICIQSLLTLSERIYIFLRRTREAIRFKDISTLEIQFKEIELLEC